MDEESLDENSEKHSDEEDEELQSALLELIEYVSMGVMVVHTYFLEQEKAIH